jgi:hypothetical protein
MSRASKIEKIAELFCVYSYKINHLSHIGHQDINITFEKIRVDNGPEFIAEALKQLRDYPVRNIELV